MRLQSFTDVNFGILVIPGSLSNVDLHLFFHGLKGGP